MEKPLIQFQMKGSNLICSLYPDSRNYVYVQWGYVNDAGEVVGLDGIKLTSEYLLDMCELSATAGSWIVANCVNIQEDGRHLYFKFRTLEDGPPPQANSPSATSPSGWWIEFICFLLGFLVALVWPVFGIAYCFLCVAKLLGVWLDKNVT